MGPLILIIPVLFLLICGTFILLHSCYYRWKIGNAFRRKREAAKISLVNILQMTNPSLITPSWISNGLNSSSRKDKLSKNPTESTPPKFDPRNPKLLSSEVTLPDHDAPPPCYEDLFGSDGITFVYSIESNPTPPERFSNSAVDKSRIGETYSPPRQTNQFNHRILHDETVSNDGMNNQIVIPANNIHESALYRHLEEPEGKSFYNSSIATLHL